MIEESAGTAVGAQLSKRDCPLTRTVNVESALSMEKKTKTKSAEKENILMVLKNIANL
jgi:hypothetical protein